MQRADCGLRWRSVTYGTAAAMLRGPAGIETATVRPTGRAGNREVQAIMPFTLLKSAVACALAMLAAGLPAAAQDYPTRNITIVVPLAAGTGMDSIVRIYAEDLSKALGKPVVVENQPGAALMLAAQNVARATPDGHTLLVSTC